MFAPFGEGREPCILSLGGGALPFLPRAGSVEAREGRGGGPPRLGGESTGPQEGIGGELHWDEGIGGGVRCCSGLSGGRVVNAGN